MSARNPDPPRCPGDPRILRQGLRARSTTEPTTPQSRAVFADTKAFELSLRRGGCCGIDIIRQPIDCVRLGSQGGFCDHRSVQPGRGGALQETDEAMSRPTLEVADIVRAAGDSFWDKHKSHFAWVHRKVLDAIIRCRTAALGGHRDTCTRCGHQAISFNSCRNRHCPKCQGNARAKWLAARSAELLPVPYFHVVFTLPHSLSALVLQNKRLLYDLLYRTSAATMLELARDPKHLGADIGFLGVLHTWGQNLEQNPHS